MDGIFNRNSFWNSILYIQPLYNYYFVKDTFKHLNCFLLQLFFSSSQNRFLNWLLIKKIYQSPVLLSTSHSYSPFLFCHLHWPPSFLCVLFPPLLSCSHSLCLAPPPPTVSSSHNYLAVTITVLISLSLSSVPPPPFLPPTTLST